MQGRHKSLHHCPVIKKLLHRIDRVAGVIVYPKSRMIHRFQQPLLILKAGWIHPGHHLQGVACPFRLSLIHIYPCVQEGCAVEPGQPVALVGNNGESQMPHIHIGAWMDNQPLAVSFDSAAMEALVNRVGSAWWLRGEGEPKW